MEAEVGAEAAGEEVAEGELQEMTQAQAGEGVERWRLSR